MKKKLILLATLVFSANILAQVNHTINISDFNDPDLSKKQPANEPFNLIIEGTEAISDYYSYNNENYSPFYDNQNIKSVLGNDVTTVRNSAFTGCSSLKTIVFPNATSSSGK